MNKFNINLQGMENLLSILIKNTNFANSIKQKIDGRRQADYFFNVQGK